MRPVALGSLVLLLGLACAALGQDPPLPAAAVEKAETNQHDPAAKSQRQIQLKVKVVEYSRSATRRLGVDCSEAFNSGEQQRSDWLAGFLAFLSRNNLIKTHAEPTLITTDGRPAHFQSGPTVAGRKIGTALTFTPTLLDNGRLRLNLHTVTTEVDRQSVAANRRRPTPCFKTSETDRNFELDLDSTVICPGIVRSDMQQIREEITPAFWRTTTTPVETQMLYVVTPQLVTDDGTVPAAE